MPVAFPLIACPLGAAYSLAGRSSDAISLLEEGAREGLAMGRMGGHSLIVVRLGEAYLLAGRLDEADDAARRALQMAREKSERGHEAYALHLLGNVVARRAQRTRGRRSHVAQASRSPRALDAPAPGALPRESRPARVPGGRIASARQLFDAGIAAFHELEMPFWLERAEAEARSLA